MEQTDRMNLSAQSIQIVWAETKQPQHTPMKNIERFEVHGGRQRVRHSFASRARSYRVHHDCRFYFKRSKFRIQEGEIFLKRN